MAILKMKYGVISADDHVQEAPDVWTNRMSKAKFGDDIPHIVELPDGTPDLGLGRQRARIRRPGAHRRGQSQGANLGRSAPLPPTSLPSV